MLNTKEDILKNVDDQTVLDPVDLHCIFFLNGGRQWERKLSYQRSSKYLLLCFHKMNMNSLVTDNDMPNLMIHLL